MHSRKTLFTVARRYRIVIATVAASMLAAPILQNDQSRCLAIASAKRVSRAQGLPTDGPGIDTSLTYIAGSSVKVEQIIGDCDWAVLGGVAGTGPCKRTASQTITRFDIEGNDIGYTFEQPEKNRLIYLCGDTISSDPSTVKYHAGDAIAWSTSSDPTSGFVLNFFTNTDGSPLLVQPPAVQMGPDDVPNSGIDVGGKIYLICNTGSDTSLPNPHEHDTSILAGFDDTANTFTTGRTISSIPGGHFIITSPYELPAQFQTSQLGPGVLMYGLGAYRATDVYLSFTPESSFESGAGTLYFTGLADGRPTWSDQEPDSVPVVQDNPLGGPAWPNDSPTIGNVSVNYLAALGLWLMTYDGGRQSQATNGIYFSYAAQPWGPWSQPQLIFNQSRDNGLGVFIYSPNSNPTGPAGPTIGDNPPTTTHGANYAPGMIGRFTRINGDTLSLSYTMSTFNPYTVVRMKSDFKITITPDFSLAFAQPTIAASVGTKVPVTLNVNRTGGFEGNVTVTPPKTLPRKVVVQGDPISTKSDSVSFKLKIKGAALPGTYALVFAGKDNSGRERDATLTLVIH